MSEREAETIWMSRIDMNIPNTMIRNAKSRCELTVSGGSIASWAPAFGDAASADIERS
jgi:hypothetical protein